MKIYYNTKMYPEAPEYCVVDDVEFIQSNVNQIVIESEEDEERWEEIRFNPDGFLEYVESEIYESFDDELKEIYANSIMGSSDVIEHEFVITRRYMGKKI